MWFEDLGIRKVIIGYRITDKKIIEQVAQKKAIYQRSTISFIEQNIYASDTPVPKLGHPP